MTARWRPGDPRETLAAAVARGAVLAVPTESSYGLAVDPRNPTAVEAISRGKGREAGKPLPVVVAGVDQLALLGVDPADPRAVRVARCWPGAVSGVLPLRPDAPDLPAAAGERTVAVRVPDHRLLLAVLAAAGPLTATSANPSGEPPLLDPDGAAGLLDGHDALVVDGGRLGGGPPSTLVAFPAGGGWEVLRPGRVGAGRLTACLGPAAGGPGREGSPGRAG
jgi:L-threonylcarbamoyladenylate synthase